MIEKMEIDQKRTHYPWILSRLYLAKRYQNDSPEKTRDYRGDIHSIKQTSSSPIRRLFLSLVKSAIAISINLRTGCKGRHEIVFPCKGEAVKDSIFRPRRSGFPARNYFRGVAARIKASCGIKNLCNQLSNLLPHISRPMSRHPASVFKQARDLPTLSLGTF